MPLDFKSIAAPRQVVVPVWNGHFEFEHKDYFVRPEEPGWHLVELKGNHARVIEAVPGGDPRITTWNDLMFGHFATGYTHNNSIVFSNFDVAKRKFKFGLSAPLYFNGSQTFEAVQVVVWEDGKVYWVQPNYRDVLAAECKSILESNGTLIEQKGITNELRTAFLFHALERENLRKIQEEVERKENHEKMMAQVPYRLQHSFERAGAKLVNYSLSGSRIVVDWRLPGSDYVYNSVIDSNTWMVNEAGYCMSNDDKRHNITSLVKTAEEYESEDLVHITRR